MVHWRYSMGQYKVVHTPLIYVVFAPISKIPVHGHFRADVEVFLVARQAVAFGHDNEFATRDVVYLHCLSHKFFRLSIRVDVCSIPLR